MTDVQEYYENYVKRLNEIIYNNVAIKLGTLRGFNESLKKDYDKTIKSFPLLHFIVESLQVDCVLTISKLVEGKRGDKTIHKFIDFTSSHMTKLKGRFINQLPAIISENKLELEKHQVKIKRILTQRDKYYAHSDNNYFLTPGKLVEDFPNTFGDLVDITIALQSIISNHTYVLNGSRTISISDFAYVNTFKTIDFLKQSTEDWLKKYRPDEKF